MVYLTRRVAPTPLGPTDPGYGTAQQERRPQVLLSDWTPRNMAAHEETVEVYSNCEQVELFLNGQSLGVKERPADESPRVWKVPFAPGLLRAVGTNRGKRVATHELRTAGRPAKILLSADRNTLAPAWDDVVYVAATVVDANGMVVPNANDLITFKVTGPGAVVAVDSADNNSHEPFQANARRAYQGRCFAMLRASAPAGRITLTASSPGLMAGAVSLKAVARSSSVHIGTR
jgi:beta-galactosidase